MARKGLIADLERDAVEIAVPTESEPVASAAEVACVHCRRRVPLRETDVVGLGYRCLACSDKADLAEMSGEPDVADHLVAADRARFAAQGKRILLRALAIFALLVAGGTILLVVMPSPAAIKILLGALIMVLGVGGHGYARWRRFRLK